jgi:hypothetical protein
MVLTDRNTYIVTNLFIFHDFVSLLDFSKCHMDSYLFSFNNASDIIPRVLTLRKLDNFGLTLVLKLVSQLPNKFPFIHICGVYSSHFVLLSRLRQGLWGREN